MNEELTSSALEDSPQSVMALVMISARSETAEALSYHKLLTEPQVTIDTKAVRPRPFENSNEKQNELSIKVREKTCFELIEASEDPYPLLSLRKCLRRLQSAFSQLCSLIISNAVFEAVILCFILMNILVMALEDPLASEQDPTLQVMDTVFLFVYTVEAALKVGGMGLLFCQGAYLRDSWNLLDFAIVLTAWIEYTVNEGVNLSALRTLRVLRPLRSISSIEGLRILIEALITSVKPLLLSLLVLFFFLAIFAIAGLQMLTGSFKYRCLDVSSGVLLDSPICGNTDCPASHSCVQSLDNPNYGTTHFDNVINALLLVFQCITLEGWSLIMQDTQTAFSDFIFIYYIPLVFIGAFLLLNFTLAVIKSSFTKGMNKVRTKPQEEEHLNSSFLRAELEGSENIPKDTNGNDSLTMVRDKARRTSILSALNIHSKIQVRKSMLSKLRNTNNIDMLVVALREDEIITSDSLEDVKPLEKSPKVSMPSYKFVYNDGTAPSHRCSLRKKYPLHSKRDLFRMLIMQKSYKKSFGVVFGWAQEITRKVSINDKHTRYVQGHWSGIEVANSEKLKVSLSELTCNVWSPGLSGYLQRFQQPFQKLVNSRWFQHTMTLSVLLNTIVLSLDHYGIQKDMEEVLAIFNYTFSGIFLAEMLLKMIGLGIVGYFKDIMNYLDAAVVAISCIEIAFMSGNSTFTALRTFRIFRVLRVARLFRYMQSMAAILKVLSASLHNFLYLALLLLLFTLIFALLGMQIFGGHFQFEEGVPRANFDDFSSAFLTVFQVLSLENWQDIMYDGIRSLGPASALFFVTWIFLGNFILLNLFLAILLDSFDQSEDDAKKERITPTEREEPRQTSKSLAELRRAKSQTPEKPLFHDVVCEKSWGLFVKSNCLRELCYKICNSPRFEKVIFFMIFLSSVKLVWDTYLLEEASDSDLLQVSWVFDVCFTVCFTVEFLIKSISMGFIFDKQSYMRDLWNQLDLFIIFFSILELAVQSVDLPFIKVLRLLRTLRPLRFISHNLSMKLVVTALLESLSAIVNVVIVMLIVWLIFAILGVALFKGKFYTCENESLKTQDDCELYGYVWRNADSNFDNVAEAMVTLFIISSLEGWPSVMYQAVDARGEGQAPKKNYNPAAAYYFVVFIFIGSFFLVNFFIGVVFMHFNNAKRNENSSYNSILNKKQQKWLEMQPLILYSKPQFDRVQIPKNWLKKFCYYTAKNTAFEIGMLVCILINMVVMAIIYEGASSKYVQVLEIFNLVFTGVFIAECAIKWTGLGSKVYFASKWNRFDFVVVLASIVDVGTLYFMDTRQSVLSWGPQFARMIRVLRVVRLIRVLKSLKSLQDLIAIMGYSLKAILNVLSLLFLLFFIYAILGVFIFYRLDESDVITRYTNFKNFGMAMLTLFRISTGEDWQLIMYACREEVGTTVSVLYFGSFVIITMFVMLNLFIMVIVQTYEDYEKDPKNTLQLFSADVKKFKKAWAMFSQVFGGVRLDYRRLPDFLYELGELDEKLGIHKNTSYSKVIKILSLMDLHIDVAGHVYYNDMLYAVLQRRHAKKRKLGKIAKQILKREEKHTKRKLEKLRERNKSNLEVTMNENNHNLLITMIYVRSIFRTWKNWTRNRILNGSSGNITPRDSLLQYPGENSLVDLEEAIEEEI